MTDSLPQHLAALERANRIRLARAELKRAILRGDRDAADIVDTGSAIPWEATTMPVIQLLTAQRRWGHTRARKLLVQLGIREQRPLGALTPRQRGRLAGALRGEDVSVERFVPVAA